MSEHLRESCQFPKFSRRIEGFVWVCPACNRAWVPRRSTRDPARPLIGYSMPVWGWWLFAPEKHGGA